MCWELIGNHMSKNLFNYPLYPLPPMCLKDIDISLISVKILLYGHCCVFYRLEIHAIFIEILASKICSYIKYYIVIETHS